MFIRGRFEILFHPHRRCKQVAAYTAYEDAIECSETSARTIQTPGYHLKARIQHSEHGESLKSRITNNFPMYEQHEQFVVLWKNHWIRNPRIARSNPARFNDGSGKRFL
jgi:hypothetical protein